MSLLNVRKEKAIRTKRTKVILITLGARDEGL